MRLETERQKATKSGNEFVAICRFNLPPFAARRAFIFSEQFAILGSARVTPYFKGGFMARQNLAAGCAESRETVTRWTRNIWQDILRNASLVLTALRTLLLRMLPRVLPPCCEASANRVANSRESPSHCMARCASSRSFRPVALRLPP